ncbi:MAG TPA: 50S ribosomal protein L24 [Syntrophomonadaceae bacterium]|nr:50S ribosomal protein L24 [Syntrophomonadaceae bacterium]
MRIKKGDKVLVLAGKDTGKEGKVLRVLPKASKLVVEGVNRVKKHQKPTPALPQGGIERIESPLNISNVMLMCDRCDEPTRVGAKVLDNGEKVRYCKKCGEMLD